MGVLIGIGIPGSGKTTCLKAIAEKSGSVYISSDEVRAEVNGRADDQRNMQIVWSEVYFRIRTALEHGYEVVVDATNAKQRDRVRLVEFCLRFTKRVEAAWFATPLETCLSRNRVRERQVPEKVIIAMETYLLEDPPCKREGFSEIYLIIPPSEVK